MEESRGVDAIQLLARFPVFPCRLVLPAIAEPKVISVGSDADLEEDCAGVVLLGRSHMEGCDGGLSPHHSQEEDCKKELSHDELFQAALCPYSTHRKIDTGNVDTS